MAMVLLVLALVAAVGYAVRGTSPSNQAAALATPEEAPVLLVPGYGGSTTGVAMLAGQLAAAGRNTTVVHLVGDGRGDLRVQAAALAKAAKRVMFLQGAPSVDVVGFSAGGVIARIWASQLGGSGMADQVITLGSPHHGTDLTGRGVPPGLCPPACRQLLPSSDLLAELNAVDETPDGPQWVSIWTTDDATVPPESSALDGALGFSVQSVCGAMPIGHRDLPRTLTTARLVLSVLDTGTDDIPARGVC
jgi:triacylglycerol esterase/lipase EstA (alpha/beta hydrolase family)